MRYHRLFVAALAYGGLACSTGKTPTSDPEARADDASSVAASSETGALDAGAKPNCAAGMPDSCPDGCIAQNALVRGRDGGCANLVNLFCGVPLDGVATAEVCVVEADGGVVVFPSKKTERGLNDGRLCTQIEQQQAWKWSMSRCD